MNLNIDKIKQLSNKMNDILNSEKQKFIDHHKLNRKRLRIIHRAFLLYFVENTFYIEDRTKITK